MINFLFYFFSILLIIFSFLVIFTNHPVFSLLFLISSFLSSSFLLLLLEYEFLAFIFITIYVGAIAVLFLFSIMMLDFKRNSLQKNLTKFFPVGILFSIILIVPIINNIYFSLPTIINYNTFYFKTNLNWFDFSESILETEALGKVLYTYFVFHLLLAGIILLVVLIGIVHLMTNNTKHFNKNKQILFKQLAKSTNLI